MAINKALKVLYIAAAATLFTAAASAQLNSGGSSGEGLKGSWNIDRTSAAYGGTDGKMTIEVSCSGSSICEKRAELQIDLKECRVLGDVITRQKASGKTKTKITFDIPGDSSGVTCKNTKQRMFIDIDEDSSLRSFNPDGSIVGEVTVRGGIFDSSNTRKRNSGRYMYISANENPSNQDGLKIHNWVVSDKLANPYDQSNVWDSGSVPEGMGAVLIVEETNPRNSLKLPEACAYKISTPRTNVIQSDTAASGGISQNSYTVEASTSNTKDQCDQVESDKPAGIFSSDFNDGLLNSIQDPGSHGGGKPGRTWELESWGSVHDASYRPRGDIVAGYKLPAGGMSGLGGGSSGGGSLSGGSLESDWFICDAGNDGLTVTTSKNEYNAVRCDAKSFDTDWRTPGSDEWVPVQKCEDGVDNDGDGRIDHESVNPSNPDPECGSPDETEVNTGQEPEPAKCSPVVEYSGGGDFTAKWDNNPDTSQCDYRQTDTWTSSENYPTLNPHGVAQIECRKDKNIQVATGPTSAPGTEGEPELTDFCRRIEYYQDRVIMPVAVYMDFNRQQLEDEGIAAIENSIQLDTGDSWQSDYVDSTGWDPAQQTLKQAEQKYSVIGNALARSTWESRRLLNTENSYQHVTDANSSWFAASQKLVGYNSPPSHGTGFSIAKGFEGGFAGKCQKGSGNQLKAEFQVQQTRSGSSGRCRYAGAPQRSENPPNIEVNTLSLKVLSDSSTKAEGEGLENHYGGIVVNRTQIQKWKEIYGQDKFNGNSNFNRPEIKAQCFVGGQSDGLAEEQNRLNLTATLKDKYTIGGSEQTEKIYLVGKLPERPGLAKEQKQDYSCIWGFQQKFTGTIGNLGFYGKDGNRHFTHGNPKSQKSEIDSAYGGSVDVSGDGSSMSFEEAKRYRAGNIEPGVEAATPASSDTNTLKPFTNFVKKESDGGKADRTTNPVATSTIGN